jgi:hypothetical protein
MITKPHGLAGVTHTPLSGTEWPGREPHEAHPRNP